MLSEASLVTNGFSARFGQALSGLVNVVTREPGEAWEGRVAYEGDRPFGGGLDRGLDRLALRADGPIKGRLGTGDRARYLGADGRGLRSTRPRPPIHATPARQCPIRCPTTAASSGPARPSSWSR